MAKLLTKLKINSVASVDRGAGEDVKVVLMKRDDKADKRDQGVVSKLFSYVWGDKVDKATEALNKSVQSIVQDETKREMLEKTIGQFGDHLNEIVDDVNKAVAIDGDGKGDGNDGEDEMTPKVKKALGLADNASEEDVLKKLDEVIEQAKADSSTKGGPKGPGDDRKKVPNPDLDTDQDDINKMDLPEAVKKRLEKTIELEKNVTALRKANDLVAFQKRAVGIGLPEADGLTLQKAFDGDAAERKESLDKLLGYIKSSIAVAKTSDLFKEFGAAGGDVHANAYDQLMAKAKDLRKGDPKLTEAQAFAKAYEDPGNREIVEQYKSEDSARRRATAA